MSNIGLECQRALSGFKIAPDLEVTLAITVKYHLFVQVPEEQDTVYISINHNALDENIHRLNCSLYTDDTLVIFEIHGHKYSGEICAAELLEEDKRDLNEIYNYIATTFFPQIKKQLVLT